MALANAVKILTDLVCNVAHHIVLLYILRVTTERTPHSIEG